MQLTIINIVIHYKLAGTIDSNSLKKQSNFSGYTAKDGKKTARIFLNGTCIVTGVKSEPDGDTFILSIFPNNPIKTKKVINMTACGKLPFNMYPFKLCTWHRKNLASSPFLYESEIFPAIYWTKEPETVYFFMSGAVIITGLKSIARLCTIWDGLLQDISTAMREN